MSLYSQKYHDRLILFEQHNHKPINSGNANFLRNRALRFILEVSIGNYILRSSQLYTNRFTPIRGRCVCAHEVKILQL